MPKQWWPRGDLSYVVDAKGDLLVGVENDTAMRLPVGSDGQALIADSSQDGGVRWGNVQSGGGTGGGTVIVDVPSPQSVWIIDVGEIADIMVIDSAGTVVEPGNIKYEGTKVTLTFSAPFSGQAYCFI